MPTITDSDWHDIYDRTDYVASPKELIKENVWIGEKSLILKVQKVVKILLLELVQYWWRSPANVVFAGNPARR